MKKMIFIVLVFILSINIFAKTGVEKQVEKIREEFIKINSEKNYIVETGGHSGNEVIAEYYKKNGELKKVVVYADATLENYVIQYYFKDDEVFFIYESKNEYKMKDDGTFDKKSLKETEKRYYFDDDGTLIRYIENNKIYNKGNIPKKYEKAAKDNLELLSELE